MTLLIILRQGFECLNNFLLLILPDMNSLIPTDTNYMAYFFIFDICWIMHAYELGKLIFFYSVVSDFIFRLSIFILGIHLLEALEYFRFVFPIYSFDFWFFWNLFFLIIRILSLLFLYQSIFSREDLFWIFVDVSCIFGDHCRKLFTITKIPNLTGSIFSCCNETTLG